MNDILSNKLDMAKAVILFTEKPESRLIWQGQTPADFGTDFDRAATTYTSVRKLAISADTDNSGDTDAKAAAEDTLGKR